MMAEQVNVADFVDRIGSLPDGILRHILSLLPTKTAMSTCILSTRWRYLFPFSGNLDFDESLVLTCDFDDPSEDDRTDCFLDFVDRCVMLMNDTLVDKFRFNCNRYIDPSRVNSWICAAPLRNVLELDLEYYPLREFRREPLLVFTCGSLVTLKLGVYFTLNVPALVHLPCLKTLHLDRIVFAGKISTQRLISGCPVIEDLVIEECGMRKRKLLKLSSPSLKRLTLSISYSFELVLDAPSLVFLKYAMCVREDYTLKNLHCLSEAHISLCEQSDDEDYIALSEFLQGITSVQTLFLSDTCEYLPPLDLDELPLLENLTRLVLTTSNITLSLAMKLLRCTPNLEEFIFDGDIQDAREDECDDVPSCFSSCLKAFEWTVYHYDGSDVAKDVESLEYFLKIASVLEKMWIRVERSDRETVEKMMETVKKLGLSRTCEVKFFWKLPRSTGRWVEL